MGSEGDFLDAIRSGDAATVHRMLVGDPSLVQVVSESGYWPLDLAAHLGRCEVAEVLMAHGIPPDGGVREIEGLTPLMHAAIAGEAEIAELLLARGADPARRDDAGRTAADHARANGHAALAERLEPRRGREPGLG